MIEILLATYNGSEYLEEQINSLLSQTYADWHLTVRDDGSTDGTMDVLNEYQGMYPEKITILEDREPSRKACFNFLRLVKEVKQNHKGDYYMFCDQDDVWEPDKIEQTVKLMTKMTTKYGKETPILIHSDLFVVNEDLELVSPSFMRYTHVSEYKNLCDLLLMNSIVGCTVMINRSLLEMFSRVEESKDIHMHDHLLGLMAATFGKIGYVRSSTVKYRQHSGNSMGAADAGSIKYKISRFFNGSKAYKEDVMLTYRQVALMLSTFENESEQLDDKISRLLYGYAGLAEATKLERIYFYLKYKILKRGLTRGLFQFLWA